MNARPATFREAVTFFADRNNCREYLVRRRWPHGVRCPACGSQTVYVERSRDGWQCRTRHPRQKFTLKTGTIFEDSPIGFSEWLPMIWLTANRPRVTSRTIARTIGVTQKTAWFMLLRVRLALDDDEPDMGRLVAEHWPELHDPREDIYSEHDGEPIPPSDDTRDLARHAKE